MDCRACQPGSKLSRQSPKIGEDAFVRFMAHVLSLDHDCVGREVSELQTWRRVAACDGFTASGSNGLAILVYSEALLTWRLR